MGEIMGQMDQLSLLSIVGLLAGMYVLAVWIIGIAYRILDRE